MNISDEKLIELCKETCTLHRTSDDGKFNVWFELDTLKTFLKKLNMEDIISSKMEIIKYKASTYNNNRINFIYIINDGSIIVETDFEKKIFYTNDPKVIIDNVNGYSGDYILCMLHDEDGIDIRK